MIGGMKSACCRGALVYREMGLRQIHEKEFLISDD
jgi:hypothetical protein